MKVTDLLTDLRGMNTADLRKRACDLEDQVFRLRLQSSMGQGEAGNKVRSLRKELARVRTVLGEKGDKE
jgi:large subunit ribosomal protein L29